MRLTLFLLFLLPFAVAGQPLHAAFLVEGKIWSYEYYNDMMRKGYLESLSVCGDAVVADTSYERFSLSDENGNVLKPQSFMFVMRQEGGHPCRGVYVWNGRKPVVR